METSVVNLRKDKYTVYIGRSGKGQDGYFGNPISKGKACPVCNKIHPDNGSTLSCYEEYLIFRINHDPEFKERVKNLQGEILGCFCKPGPCHGDILAKHSELLFNESNTKV